MFKGAFKFPNKVAPAQPKMIPNSNYVAQPQRVPPKQAAPVYEDPEVAKLKTLVLKWLTIVIAGGAILLIAWRILLKFL